MNDPDPTAAMISAADVPLRELLEQFWIHCNRPTAEQMAAKNNLPLQPLARFLNSKDAPDLEETTAMARAVVPRAWQDMVIRRWHETDGPPRTDRVLPLPRRSTAPDATTAIDTAMAALTHREFGEALELLKTERDLTYEQIAKNSGHVLSKSAAHRFATHGRVPKRELLEAFVRACGVHGLDLDLWLTAWRAVNQNSDNPAEDIAETRLAEPGTASPTAAPPPPAALADTEFRLRLLGMLAAATMAGSAAATVRLCRSAAPQRWVLLAGLGAAGAALLMLLAELHQHLTPSRCAKPDGPGSAPR